MNWKKCYEIFRALSVNSFQYFLVRPMILMIFYLYAPLHPLFFLKGLFEKSYVINREYMKNTRFPIKCFNGSTNEFILMCHNFAPSERDFVYASGNTNNNAKIRVKLSFSINLYDLLSVHKKIRIFYVNFRIFTEFVLIYVLNYTVSRWNIHINGFYFIITR